MSDPLRFFVGAQVLHAEPIVISGDAHHHLRNVLRIRAGACALLLDGEGGCCRVSIEHVHADHTETRTLERWQQPVDGLPISLLQALPKGDKFELILQKGTELGLTRFVPLLTEHAVPKPEPKRQAKRRQRWQRIVSEAARQSRRYRLPQVAEPQPLRAALGQPGEELKLVLWEQGAVALRAVLPATAPPGVRLLVGPEGGFSTAEIKEITASGYQPVHLGPRILRTETAGLAATPVLQYLYGDWHRSPVADNQAEEETP
jgi:16S rRNA (uracil1498-N3)-methyltransferase